MKTTLLCNLLDCGYMDIDFLIKEAKTFDIDIHEAINYARELSCENELTCNNLIYGVYQEAMNKYELTDDEEEEIYFSTFINSIDSHLYLHTKGNEESEEVYSPEDIEKFLEENKKQD